MKNRNEKREAKKIQANKEAQLKMNIAIFGLIALAGAISYNVIFNGVVTSCYSFIF